jgi:Tfp pilus assembly protein PilN
MSRPASEREVLNLARRPFLNGRPVVRISVALLFLGLVLLLVNVSLFWSYLDDSKEKRAELEAKAAEIDQEKKALQEVDERLNSLNLVDRNQEALYLNRKIRDRTFSWSLLFERLGAVMPQEVRLERLSPRGVVAEREPQGRQVLTEENMKEGVITLALAGQAKSSEALLQFVDNLYMAPFDNPNLSRESRDEDDGLLRFDMTVEYRPEAAAPEPEVAAGPQPVLSEGTSPAPRASAAPVAPVVPVAPGRTP